MLPNASSMWWRFPPPKEPFASISWALHQQKSLLSSLHTPYLPSPFLSLCTIVLHPLCMASLPPSFLPFNPLH